MTPYQVSSKINGTFFYSGITLSESPVGCCTDLLCIPTEESNSSTIRWMPVVALQTLLMELSVLFGPCLWTMLLLQRFEISWARSSSIFHPAPPLQFTKHPHLNCSARRGVNRHSIWAILTNISMAYLL